MLGRIDRRWAASVLFLNAWQFALPVIGIPLPLIFTPIQVLHGVFLHEVWLLAYVVYWFVSRGGLPNCPSSGRKIVLLIALLGVLGVLSATVNGRPVEILGSCRYFVLAILIWFAVYWGKEYGLNFVLRNFLLGIVSSGSVTLYYTFAHPTGLIGGLPMLAGQNGPGGALGMSVVLSAWLMRERRTRKDAVIAVLTCGVGVFGASISYSKLAMLMAAAGVTAWIVLILREVVVRHSRAALAALVLGAALVLTAGRNIANDYIKGVDAFIDLKFRRMDKGSVLSRAQYFAITSEIVMNHPLFGVSYGGFYEAEQETEAFKSTLSANESLDRGTRQANPHSSFLYHASASGVPGIATIALLFLGCLLAFWRALSPRGVSGVALWFCLLFGYMIYGLTLPTLFMTSIMVLPAAAAISFTSFGTDRVLSRVRTQVQSVAREHFGATSAVSRVRMDAKSVVPAIQEDPETFG